MLARGVWYPEPLSFRVSVSMNKVDFLVLPTVFSPREALSGASERPELLNALAYHGHLDATDWLQPVVFKGAFSDTTSTLFDRLRATEKDRKPVSGKPTPEEFERARQGQEWDGGPGYPERLLLWALSQAQEPPSPATCKLLCERALEQQWRFALTQLLAANDLVASKTFGFDAVFQKALTQQSWEGGIHILADAYVNSSATSVQSVLELALMERWSKNTITHTACQGLLAALPENEKNNVHLWNTWLDQWSNTKTFTIEKLIEGLITRFEKDPSPPFQELVSKAHLTLAVDAPVEHVRKHAAAYSNYWKQAHPHQLPPFSETLLTRYGTDPSNKKMLELARRAACFSSMLERHELGTPEDRAKEQLQLYWLERAAILQVERQRRDNPQPKWKQPHQEAASFEKRQDRLERRRQRQGWTLEQMAEGLATFSQRPMDKQVRWIPNAGWGWLVGQMKADPQAWEAIHRPQGDRPSLARQILGNHQNYVVVPWLEAYRTRVAEGLVHDPGLPSLMLQLLQKLGNSDESRKNTRRAWEDPEQLQAWPDGTGNHLAGTLSFLAHRGMLDLRLETLDPVGGLDGIIVPLRELRLEQSLAATANRPRPRM